MQSNVTRGSRHNWYVGNCDQIWSQWKAFLFSLWGQPNTVHMLWGLQPWCAQLKKSLGNLLHADQLQGEGRATAFGDPSSLNYSNFVVRLRRTIISSGINTGSVIYKVFLKIETLKNKNKDIQSVKYISNQHSACLHNTWLLLTSVNGCNSWQHVSHEATKHEKNAKSTR